MKNLYIIGARGFGREVFALAKECDGFQKDYVIKGFLDDKADALNGYVDYPPIISSVEQFAPSENDVFICALGDPHWQRHYAEIVLEKGGKFISLVHPTASIGKNTKMGIGCIIHRDVFISCDISFGDFVTCQPKAVVGHDVIVGDYCHLGTNTVMGGYSQVNSLTTLHPGVIILPHVKVGEDCVVGAGSVVIRKVKLGTTVYGNPAKVLKF
jgi:sugar O-acyltransferase (sialic acid O-acetyltransferase NeuD family)